MQLADAAVDGCGLSRELPQPLRPESGGQGAGAEWLKYCKLVDATTSGWAAGATPGEGGDSKYNNLKCRAVCDGGGGDGSV